MNVTDEHLIISNLMGNKEYFNKVIPFLKSEYFHNDDDRRIFNCIKKYSMEYSKVPDYTIVRNIITSADIDDKQIANMLDTVSTITDIELPKDTEYVINKTESFCQNRALHNAIYKAYEIYDGTNKTEKIGIIPDLVKDAICISFNNSVGHDYDDDAESRWEYYNSPENKIPFEFDTLNAITNGGVSLKTFNLIAAGVNVGKTLILIILAAMYKRLGFDVLYVTNEVSEMEVGKRADASLMGIDTDQLVKIEKTKFLAKIAKMKERNSGRLVIKEFPTGTCTSLKVEAELQELELKKGFKPTIIINDYITINASSSISKNANMYQYYNSIAEEMRALAVKYNCVMWSAAQLKTEAMEATDVSLSQLSDSQGIARTADLVWAVIRHEELDRLREIKFIQLKTRYHKQRYVAWNMGIDVSKHRLNDIKPDIEGVTDIYSAPNYTIADPKADKLKVVSKTKPKSKIKFSRNSKDDINEHEQYVDV